MLSFLQHIMHTSSQTYGSCRIYIINHSSQLSFPTSSSCPTHLSPISSSRITRQNSYKTAADSLKFTPVNLTLVKRSHRAGPGNLKLQVMSTWPLRNHSIAPICHNSLQSSWLLFTPDILRPPHVRHYTACLPNCQHVSRLMPCSCQVCRTPPYQQDELIQPPVTQRLPPAHTRQLQLHQVMPSCTAGNRHPSCSSSQSDTLLLRRPCASYPWLSLATSLLHPHTPFQDRLLCPVLPFSSSRTCRSLTTSSSISS